MKRIIIAYIIAVSSFYLIACNKFLEIPPPATSLVDASVFDDSITAAAAVLGLYERAMQGAFSVFDGGGIVCAGLQSDELLVTSTSTTMQEFYFCGLTPTNTFVLSFWTQLYQLVYQSNAIIQQAERSVRLSAAAKAQFAGEAHLMRAYSLFRLQNWYGDIPMPLTTDYKVSALLNKTSRQLVLDQVVEDLKIAAANLPPRYPANSKTRPTKYAAWGLLSRVYLFQGNWEEAEAAASAVIDAGEGFALAATLPGVFAVNSPETIWQLRPTEPNANTSLASLVGQKSGVPPFATYEPQFIQSMDPADLRMQNWISSHVNLGQTYWQPMKYRYANTSLGVEYLVLVRLAEIYLNRAEARLRLDQPELACLDINLIRERAGLDPLEPNDELLSQLQNERKWELQVEQDFRWTDLKRWGLIDEVIAALKPDDWKPTAALLPLPQTEINNNNNLSQNPGY